MARLIRRYRQVRAKRAFLVRTRLGRPVTALPSSSFKASWNESSALIFLSFFAITGKYTKNSPITDGRSRNPLFQGAAFEDNLAKVEKLREIATAKEAEVAHLVLAWYLKQETIDAVIPGAKQPEQVLQNIKALNIHLTVEECAQISGIFKR